MVFKKRYLKVYGIFQPTFLSFPFHLPPPTLSSQHTKFMQIPVKNLDSAGLEEILQLLEQIEIDVEKCANDAVRYNKYEEILQMEVTSFETVDDLKTDFALKSKLWRGIHDSKF